MGPTEPPAGGARGGVLVVAGEACCGYLLPVADTAVRAAFEEEEPITAVLWL